MRVRLEAEDVRAALAGRAPEILDRFGADYRNGRNLTLRECPACKRRQRRAAVKIHRDTGLWIHHSGPAAACSGDALDLLGALAGLDRSRFPELLELAASIAGIAADTDPAELARIRAEHAARREARARRAAEQRAAAETLVPGLWAALARHHRRGEGYLDERELDPTALRQRGDLVRYYPDGAPAVLLRSLDDGRAINIARRLIDDSERKILTLSIARELGLDEHEVDGSFSTAGTLVGRVTDAALVLLGESDMVPIAHALHCRTLGADRPFVLCDRRRVEGPETIRSPMNYERGVAAFQAAHGGSLCVRRRWPPGDFPSLVMLVRDPTAAVQFIVCGAVFHAMHPFLTLPVPIRVPALRMRASELLRIVDEYAADALSALGADDACFTGADRTWVLDHAVGSLPEIETATLRLVAFRQAGTILGAAKRLGMSPIAISQWIDRRRLARPRRGGQ